MIEQWRSIEGLPHEVSDCGRVRNSLTGRVLKPGLLRNGYRLVAMCHLGQRRDVLVHRLVLEAFVGACPVGYQCNHKNGVKADNRLENLEWVTPSQNRRHALSTGLAKVARGDTHSSAKLTAKDVVKIRALRAYGESLNTIAERFDVSFSLIGMVCRRDIWRHVP